MHATGLGYSFGASAARLSAVHDPKAGGAARVYTAAVGERAVWDAMHEQRVLGSLVGKET